MDFLTYKAPTWLRDNGKHLDSDEPGEWMCLSVLSNFETKVIGELRRLRIPYFVAVELELARKRRTNKANQHPVNVTLLWRGYVFCRANSADIAKLKKINRVTNVLRTCFQPELLETLREAHLRNIPDLEEMDFEPEMELQPGEKFKINSGPFEGQTARLESVENDGQLAVNLVSSNSEIKVMLPAVHLGRNRTNSEKIKLSDLVFEEDTIDRLLSESKKDIPSQQEESLERQVVRTSVEEINAAVIEYLSNHPEAMFELTPRKFEELVAELLVDMGLDVELTPAQKDGGRDVLAYLNHPMGKLLTIVECKRHSPDNPVGVDIVERFMYTIDRKDMSSMGLIATTSRFTSGAKRVEKDHPWRLGLRDFGAVSEWLGAYGTWHSSSTRGLWLPEKKLLKGNHKI